MKEIQIFLLFSYFFAKLSIKWGNLNKATAMQLSGIPLTKNIDVQDNPMRWYRRYRARNDKSICIH